MRKLTIAAVFITLLAAAFSCKKSSTSSSPSQEIVGSWKITKVYIDSNRNGKMDPNELVTDTSVVNPNLVYSYSSNGTAAVTYYSLTVIQATWALEDNNTYIRLSDSNGTTYDQILSLTSSSMELEDTSGVSFGLYTQWSFYDKQ